MSTSWHSDADRIQQYRDSHRHEWIETVLMAALLLLSVVVLGVCAYLGTCR